MPSNILLRGTLVSFSCLGVREQKKVGNNCFKLYLTIKCTQSCIATSIFRHAFTACGCVFKVITLAWANQWIYLTLKTQPHAVNASWNQVSQRNLREKRESISGIKSSFKRIEERHQGNCNLQLNLRKWYKSQCDTFLCKWIGYKRVMVNSFYSIDFRLTIEVCTHRTQLHYSD